MNATSNFDPQLVTISEVFGVQTCLYIIMFIIVVIFFRGSLFFFFFFL